MSRRSRYTNQDRRRAKRGLPPLGGQRSHEVVPEAEATVDEAPAVPEAYAEAVPTLEQRLVAARQVLEAEDLVFYVYGDAERLLGLGLVGVFVTQGYTLAEAERATIVLERMAKNPAAARTSGQSGFANSARGRRRWIDRANRRLHAARQTYAAFAGEFAVDDKLLARYIEGPDLNTQSSAGHIVEVLKAIDRVNAIARLDPVQ